ncbi:MAG: hypothetical protein JWO89_455 [Verrucomicrobiaceae bacterium]|nr:hypothetical protein [Verrucomicrobiaceae bacterium]MDB6117193.1 hypothetical protein [Verrucomicrobiaceae bacterium]
MNGKKIACILLLCTVGIVIYFAQTIHGKAAMKRADAENAETAAIGVEGERDTANLDLIKIKSETNELSRFLQTWSPHADRIQTQSEVEEAVTASLRNSNTIVISQKFEIRENRGALVIPRVVRAALVLEDDYAKTLNWVGELERRLPLSRVTNYRVTGGENGHQVHAEITLEVPIINLKAVAPVSAAEPKKV